MKKLLASLLSLVLTFSLAFNTNLAYASSIHIEDVNISPASTELVSKINEASKNAILYGESIKVDKDGLLFISKSSKELNVTDEFYSKMLTGIEIENNLIKAGKITITANSQGVIESFNIIESTNSNRSFHYDSNTLNDSERLTIQPRIAPMGGGIYFSNSDLVNLSYALATGSGAAWLTAELAAAGIVTVPASLPLGIIAAASGLGAAAIAWYASTGYGILFMPVGGVWTAQPLKL